MLSTEMFIAWAQALGFAEVGFCLPDSFDRSRQIVVSQVSLSERKQLRFFPANDLPQAKSIAVLLWPYLQAKLPDEGEMFVDSYYAASNAAYHAAQTLEKRVQEAGYFAKANVAYPAKEAALRAQMGVIGHNSLLITPSHGSRVVIILMATSIDVSERQSDSSPKTCIKCGKCLKACPTEAIDEHGLSHPERCLRNYMMEGIVVPEDMRSKIGMRLLGCDICQRVCPMQNGKEQKAKHPYFLHEFLTEDNAVFSEAVSRLSEEIGRNVARPQRVRAQVSLLAGNSTDTAYLPVLRQWEKLPFDAVRQHAQWAIQQITLDRIAK